MKAVELLQAALAKLEAPGAWTQGECARDADGKPAGFKEATCFCSYGALYAINKTDPAPTAAWNFLETAVREVAPLLGGAIAYNDTPGRKQEEVVAVFKRAIELAENA